MADPAQEDPRDLKDHVLICGWSVNVPRIVDGLLAAGALIGHSVVLVNQADDAAISDLRERFPGVDIRHVSGPYQHRSHAQARRRGLR